MQLVDHIVHAVRPGAATAFADGVLEFDAQAVTDLVTGDDGIASVTVHAINTGDDVRMVHVLDCVKPVCKEDGLAGVFPGVLCTADTVNTSPTHRLQGVVVTAMGELTSGDAFLSQEEGIIDLRSGTALSPLAGLSHVALELEFTVEADNAEREAALRRVTAAVAEHLASAARTDGGIAVEDPGSRTGQRVIHICELSSFGALFDTRVLGKSAMGLLPTLLTPQNLADGWVMSADYHYAGQRNYTCLYQDNPVLRAVGRDGVDMVVEGVVVLPVAGSHEDKARGAAVAANIASTLDVDGAIITAVAAGNAHLDVMFAVRACERRGIRTVLVLVEFAGPDGSDPGMVDTTPEADLIISTGNREELVSLAACEKVLGGERLLDPDAKEDPPPAGDAVTVPLRTIAGSNNELGAWTIAAEAR